MRANEMMTGRVTLTADTVGLGPGRHPGVAGKAGGLNVPGLPEPAQGAHADAITSAAYLLPRWILTRFPAPGHGSPP